MRTVATSSSTSTMAMSATTPTIRVLVLLSLTCLWSGVSAIQIRLPGLARPRAQFDSAPTWETLEGLRKSGESARRSSPSTSTPPLPVRSVSRRRQQFQTRVSDLFPLSRKLRVYQRSAAEVASSFEISSDFKPPPFLTNQHLQTIVGFLTRDIPESAYVEDNNLRPFIKAVAARAIVNVIEPTLKSMVATENDSITSDANGSRTSCGATSDTRTLKFWDERERIATPDGDWFHADYKAAGTDNPKGLVLLVHGLEANSEAALSIDIAESYCNMGLDVVCLNFRGCTGEPNDTLAGYHLGFTDDLMHLLNLLKDSFGDMPPTYISGFSLGGNVALKALGELGTAARDKYNIRGAAVACPPFDSERDSQFLDKEGFNRSTYCGGILNKFRKKVRYQLETMLDGDDQTEEFQYAAAMAAQTIREFDDAFIAPIYGFENNIDYYRKNSSRYFLEKIAVPTLVIRANDDPFFDPDAVPFELTAEHGGRAPVKIVVTEHGGHLGYCFQQVSANNNDIDDGNNDRQGSMPLRPKTSWLPEQLSNFLEHVQESEERVVEERKLRQQRRQQ